MRAESRTALAGVGMILGLAFLALSAGAGHAQEELVAEPTDVCPAIDEDYRLCSQDLMSGNCSAFVRDAEALARLYRFRLKQDPRQARLLRTTIWWNCGSANLFQIEALLGEIGSPEARAVLQSEPFRSLTMAGAGAPGPSFDAQNAGDAQAAGPQPAAEVDCDALETDAEQSACQARELQALETRHRRAFEVCKQSLPPDQRSALVAQEQAWRSELEGECTDPPCLSAGIRQRDQAIQRAFPRCGGPEGSLETTAVDARSEKTGMLPARWTPPQGPVQEVPFSFEAQSKTRGTLSTTLGEGGEQFHGRYVQMEKSLHDDLVMGIYDGWSDPQWAAWGDGPDGEWTAAGISFGDFSRFYTGRMLAGLTGDRGSAMRCQIHLNDPATGLGGGGTGTCQVSNGGRVDLRF